MTDEMYGPWAEYERKLAQKEQEQQRYQIKVKKVPAGSAPLLVRAQWLGVAMEAIATTPSQPLIDPLKSEHRRVEGRFGFLVTREAGINALRDAKRERAALFFERNWPAGMGFAFGLTK